MGNWNNKSGVPCDDLCASFECGCLGDKTWKERHAKGVEMVKRSHNDVIKWYDLDYKNGSWTDGDHQFNADGTPIIEVISIQNDVWRVAATFCNFRYKQSWLEKMFLGKVFKARSLTLKCPKAA